MDQGGNKSYWQQDDEQPVAPAVAVPQVALPETDEIHDEPDDMAPLVWQASEDIHHEKNMLWFVGLIAIVAVLLLVSIVLIRSWTFAILIVVMAAAVAVFAARPPRVMQYHLDHHGIQINDKVFRLHDFRAFGVLQDGPLYSVVLLPMKRFMPTVNVYFPAEHGEHIVDVFGEVLPMEHVEPDILDKFVRKLRF